MPIFAAMGKGFLSILILIASFFFSDEAQARVLTGGSKTEIAVEQHNHSSLAAISDTHQFEFEQSLIRIVPVSRCGQVQKYVGNGYWSVLSFSAAAFSSGILNTGTDQVTESSYLFHIYPSHNFW